MIANNEVEIHTYEEVKKIIVEVKNVYGKQVIYPISENAILFAELSGKKTLTSDAIRILKKLGYEIIVKQTTLD